MRAQEFIVEYLEPKSKRAHRAGIDLEMREDNNDPNKLWITASNHGRELGYIEFHRHGKTLTAEYAYVKPNYQGQGIAATMYDYAKELGYRIKRSPSQTDAGKAFWDKNRGEEGNVWENFADGRVKGKSRPGRVKRAGASCKGSVTDLRRKAKNTSGERARMYHWCANMMSGKKK